MWLKKRSYLNLWPLLFLCFACITLNEESGSKKTKKNITAKFNARVVIDPGHGGDDPGAIGAKGLLEKNVVLDIAKRLGRLFNKFMPNIEVIFTRTIDRHVSLEQRVAIANSKKVDVFLSLHVNSNESKDAQGFEIYSLDVASDRHAERLAARENKMMKPKTTSLDLILADLRAYSHRKDSDILAKYISLGLKKELKKIYATTSINDRGYNQAVFNVLFVNSPALLLELFFISNLKEENILNQETTREYIARGIFLGTRKFFEALSRR
jgi:N-acetylmuramoyl-L-alanine amidase